MATWLIKNLPYCKEKNALCGVLGYPKDIGSSGTKIPETFNQERQTIRTKALEREREDCRPGGSRAHLSPHTKAATTYTATH